MSALNPDNRIILAESIDSANMQRIHKSLVELFGEMSKRLIERDQLVRLIGLTFFCKANCFLIGERGVAKSYAIEGLGNSIEGTKPLWQLLLKKDTKLQEVFGRTFQSENGEWQINTKNSLLEADNVFTDEMFKAQGEILSGLLEVLVDRCYTFGDGKKRKTNILGFFGASNEYPTERFMLPYVDRFDIWVEVKQIQSKTNRRRFYLDDYVRDALDGAHIKREDIELVYSQEAEKVFFDDKLMDLYIEITTSFINSEIKTSDRKYRRIIKLIKTIAYLNNRKYVNYSDLFILLYSAWQNEIEKDRVERDLFDIVFGKTERINAFLSEINAGFNDLINEFNSYLYRYYSHKFEFVGENQDNSFLSVKKAFNNIEASLDELLIEINGVKNLFKFNQMVQEQLDNNIILIGIKSEVFTKETINVLTSLENLINERKDDIVVWQEQNKDLYCYKNNQKSNQYTATTI